MEEILKELQDILNKVGDTLKAESLYKNIKNSIGTNKQLADLFEVPEYLIKQIKELNF